MYTACIYKLKQEPLFDGKVFVYFTYMVRKIGYGRTKLKVTMYSKYSPHSESYHITTGELIKVIMYTAHIGSNGSNFLTAKVLVYWTYMVSKFGYGRTKWMVTMYYVLCTMYYVLCTMYYVLCTMYYVLCTMYFIICTKYYVLCTMYTAHISSIGSHFLTAWFLVYWTYKVSSWYTRG